MPVSQRAPVRQPARQRREARAFHRRVATAGGSRARGCPGNTAAPRATSAPPDPSASRSRCPHAAERRPRRSPTVGSGRRFYAARRSPADGACTQPVIRRRALRDNTALSTRQRPSRCDTSAPTASIPDTWPIRVGTPGRVLATSLTTVPGRAAATASAIEPAAGVGVMQPAHRHDARQQVDALGRHVDAGTGAIGGRARHPEHLRRGRPQARGLVRGDRQPHAHRRMRRGSPRADRAACVRDRRSAGSSRPVRPSDCARTNTVGLPAVIMVAVIRPTPGTSSSSCGAARRQQRTAAAASSSGAPVPDSSPAGSRNSSRISADGNGTPSSVNSPASTTSPSRTGTNASMPPADVRLPDPHPGRPLDCRDQPFADRERSDGRGQVSAVAATSRSPERRSRRRRTGSRRRSRRARTARRSPPCWCSTLRRPCRRCACRSGSGLPMHPQQQFIAFAHRVRQIARVEEHPLAGAAPHVDGRNSLPAHRVSLTSCRGASPGALGGGSAAARQAASACTRRAAVPPPRPRGGHARTGGATSASASSGARGRETAPRRAPARDERTGARPVRRWPCGRRRRPPAGPAMAALRSAHATICTACARFSEL